MSRGKRTLERGIPPELVGTLREEVSRCKTRPSRFNETILCRGPYWSRQDEVCRSVVKYPVTAVPAGNCVGKSHVGSGIALWFGVCHSFSRVVIAAPTKDQLSQVLWGGITNAYASAEKQGRYLGGRFSGLTLDWGDGWSIEGWGQGSTESKSGRHAGDLLAIIDEASGCVQSVMEAIDSLNPSRRLYLGNPLRPEGKFFEVCMRAGDPLTNVITIPSLESPHIGLERSPWGLADATWLEQNRVEYGEDSIWWQSHVLARFPGELTQTLLPAAWLEEAARVIHVRSGPVRLGVDVALGGGGDEACITARDDNGVIESEASNRWNLEQLTARVVDFVRRHDVRGEHVTFDASGVGADLDNRLRAAQILGAKGYMGGKGGGPSGRYFNLRAAAGWALRRRLDAHRSVSRPEPGRPDRSLPASLYVPQKPFHLPGHLLMRYRAELQGLRYDLDPAGRIQLEPKDKFQARLKRSPNFLDSVIMTFAFPHS